MVLKEPEKPKSLNIVPKQTDHLQLEGMKHSLSTIILRLLLG